MSQALRDIFEGKPGQPRLWLESILAILFAFTVKQGAWHRLKRLYSTPPKCAVFVAEASSLIALSLLVGAFNSSAKNPSRARQLQTVSLDLSPLATAPTQTPAVAPKGCCADHRSGNSAEAYRRTDVRLRI